MSDSINVVIRDVLPEDKNLIMSTWLKGNYYGNPYYWNIPQDIYFKEYAKFITDVLLDGDVYASVACDELNPSFILGFSVFKGDYIYWVYVKKDFRERGIGKLLLGDRKFKFSKSITRIGKVLSDKKKLIFNPF